MTDNQEWDAERIRLEEALQDAAEELLLFSGAAQINWEADAKSYVGRVAVNIKGT